MAFHFISNSANYIAPPQVLLGELAESAQNKQRRRQPGHDQGWAELVQPYLKSTQIFQCPSEPNGPAPAGSNNGGYTDYMYNGDISSYNSGTGAGLSLAAINYPLNTVLNADVTSNYSSSILGNNYAW